MKHKIWTFVYFL